MKTWGGQFALAFPTSNIIGYSSPCPPRDYTPATCRQVRPHHLACPLDLPPCLDRLLDLKLMRIGVRNQSDPISTPVLWAYPVLGLFIDCEVGLLQRLSKPGAVSLYSLLAYVLLYTRYLPAVYTGTCRLVASRYRTGIGLYLHRCVRLPPLTL